MVLVAIFSNYNFLDGITYLAKNVFAVLHLSKKGPPTCLRLRLGLNDTAKLQTSFKLCSKMNVFMGNKKMVREKRKHKASLHSLTKDK